MGKKATNDGENFYIQHVLKAYIVDFFKLLTVFSTAVENLGRKIWE